MTGNRLTPAILGSTLIFGALLGAAPQQAYGQETDFEAFYCGIKTVEATDGTVLTVPATLAASPSGSESVIYYWVRDYYPETAETPLTICDRVSTLLDSLNSQGSLGTITPGITANGSQAICTSLSCSRTLFVTLPGEDLNTVLADLRLALQGDASARQYIPPVNQADSTIEILMIGAR